MDLFDSICIYTYPKKILKLTIGNIFYGSLFILTFVSQCYEIINLILDAQILNF